MSFNVVVTTAILLTAATLVERFGIAYPMSWIKELVEVQVLQDLPCLLLVLYLFRCGLGSSVLTASLLLVWADTIANEVILVKLCVS